MTKHFGVFFGSQCRSGCYVAEPPSRPSVHAPSTAQPSNDMPPTSAVLHSLILRPVSYSKLSIHLQIRADEHRIHWC